MKKPVIGITGNQRPFREEDGMYLSYTPTGFVQGVQEAGGIPLILPIGDPATAEHYISLIDKLIITGGQHVSPQFYGAEKEIVSDDYLLERDLFELALIKEAVAAKKPIFTVCRGMQLYNVAMGGTLYQDIDNHWQENPASEASHSIETVEGTVLRDLFGEVGQINSYHHQSIKDLAPHLEVIALSPDDQIIEAVQSSHGTAFLGVQWHPELRCQISEGDKALFDYVVNQL